ncbi:TIGR00645 family protein [Aggregatibacter actinomycetemcomitans]|uniref:TIGR00645 family protein n=1 Tax=Aggregatibacter actinomycetemcomitans TaxID=714 RepID=UPI00022ADC0B
MGETVQQANQGQQIKPRYEPAAISKIIFASRWLQLPIYLGLIIVQGIYAYKFMKSLWHLIVNLQEMGSNTVMLAVLNLIDVVMIANLLVMVIIGGYEIFVSKLRTRGHPDQPEWLSHVNASVLKVKLAMSIISISSIHMLQTFVNASNMDEKTMMWQLFLHLGFLASAIAMAYTDKILYGTSHKAH